MRIELDGFWYEVQESKVKEGDWLYNPTQRIVFQADAYSVRALTHTTYDVVTSTNNPLINN